MRRALVLVWIALLVAGCQDNPGPTAVDTPRLDEESLDIIIRPEPVLYSVSSVDDGLSTLDLETAVLHRVGKLDPDPEKMKTPIAMAVRPGDGTLFVWNNSPKAHLVTVNRCTGRGTPVNPLAPSQPQLSSLAFNLEGELFGLDFDLYSVDTATGLRTLIGPITGAGRIAAADFTLGGTLYGVELRRNPRMLVIDPQTGAGTLVGHLSEDIGIIGSIVVNHLSGMILGTGDGGPHGKILFEIDPMTAAVSNIRPLSGSFPQGLGWSLPCGRTRPEMTWQRRKDLPSPR